MERKIIAYAAGLLAVLAGCSQGEPALDLVVRGGTVYDGLSASPQRVDIGVRGSEIVAVGDLSNARAARELNAAGLVVAPGFIDVQGQSGMSLLVDGVGESHVRQGITSEIIGEASSPAFWTADTADVEGLRTYGLAFDWTGFDGYFLRLQQRGTTINLGTLVPATMVRRAIVGLDNRAASEEELVRMEAMVDLAMRDGAMGLSSALIYPPGSYASTEELTRLARVTGRHGGIYATHVRGESFNLMNALDEAIAIGRNASLPVTIFHLKVAARDRWGTMGDVVAKLRAANAAGTLVETTMYPYAAGGTSLAASLPQWVQEGGREQMLARLQDPAVQVKARRDIETKIDGWENLLMASTFAGIQIASVPRESDQSIIGKRLSEIANERGQDPWDTFFDVLLQTGGRAGAIYHMMSEDDVRTGLAQSGASIGTDSSAIGIGGPLARGGAHPRTYGTFPRVLGKYVRDEQLLTLGEAIRRMTSVAAAQFHVDGRGQLRTGYAADIVVFDAAQVRDLATFEQPHQYSQGITHVIVNGVPVLEAGALTGARPGRAIYGRARRPALTK